MTAKISIPRAPRTPFIDIDNARLDDQRQVMSQIASKAHCPFCPENLEKYHTQPIIKQGRFWLITRNQWPYQHTKHHWLAIYHCHAQHLGELDPASGTELLQLMSELTNEYHVQGGALCMRFGDTLHSSATVFHLHAHLIVPDTTDPEYQPIRFKIGKSRDTTPASQ